MTRISGSFGGSGGGNGSKPKMANDGLNSTQYAKVVDLLSEGEIAGLKNGHRSIFFDNTPLATPGRSGSYRRFGTTITVSLKSHGFAIGQLVYLEFLSGFAATGSYTIASVAENTFTITSTDSGITSGTVFCSSSYTRTGNTIVVTSNEHRLSTGDVVYLQFVSGLAVTDSYEIQDHTTDTFTVESNQIGSTDGNVLWSTYNFEEVEIYERVGTQSQGFVPFANAIESEQTVNVTVTKSVPVVRTISNVNVDAARITLTFPTLQEIQNDGDIKGAEVKIQIWVQYDGAGFDLVARDTVKGRTADQYQRDYLVPLTSTKPADIKVVRVTDDAPSSKLQDSFTWSTYTEITYGRFNYPNTALVALRVNAEQFSSIPNRSYLVRGVKIRIPNNATVDSSNGRLIYTGLWDGTFGAAQWCSDPAWILWDLLISKRYGTGDFLQASKLDKWAFYSASQYCNELVPDGLGGQEPRFSCNVNIQAAEEVYKTINDMCSVFRAMPYWSTGNLTISQDKPSDPVYLFTLANVSTEGFSYQSSSQKTRPTAVVVSYLDLEIRDIAYEFVEDAAAIAKYGVITREISAFACTSRGQANRIGRWMLYAEQHENEIISFTASIDAGIIVRPGQVIEVADPLRAGQRRGGRIASATTLQVQVDDPAGITAGNDRTLSVLLPNGTLETRNVSVVSGHYITVTSPFSHAPNPNSVWVYQTDDLLASTWRVLSVTEKEKAQYEISAIAYNSSKYSYIENDLKLQMRDVSNLNGLPAAPVNLTISETLYYYQGQVRAKIIANWMSVIGVNQYQVHWRKGNGNWTVVTKVGPDYEILDITPGIFEFKVYSLSAGFKLSAKAATGAITALGKTAPPSNVSGLAATVDPVIGATLSWTPVADIDIDFYEIRLGSNWSSATVLNQVKGNAYKIGYLTDLTQTFLVKAVDTSGVYSAGSASVSVAISPPNSVAVSKQIQDPVVVLSWQQPVLTTYAISYYLVTYGDSYGTSTEIARVNSTSFSVPATWTGARKFWVAPVDIVGTVAVSPDSVSVLISQAAAPVVSGVVRGSTARLNWSAVSGTLATRSYQIRRGVTFETATILASITGTTYTLQADWSGLETFWVVAIDGNGVFGAAGSAILGVTGAPAPTISSTFAGQNVVLNWTSVKGTLNTDFYEIRRGEIFSTAVAIGTAYTTMHTLRVDWSGSQRFWVVAVDANGLFGTEASVDIVVAVPSVPAISQQVIDNNVLLRWTGSRTTLPIEYYEVRKGASWDTATLIGTKQGRFTTVFESQSGMYTYWLAGVDSAGNYGNAGSVNALVNQPPDYVLQLDRNSTWEGIKTNIYTSNQGGTYSQVGTEITVSSIAHGYSAGEYLYIDFVSGTAVDGTYQVVTATVNSFTITTATSATTSGACNIVTKFGQIVNVNTTETWQTHFTSRGYDTPQDQVSAGYSYYLMPTTTTAAYEEEFDYGAVLAGTKISATLTSTNIAGLTTITPTVLVRGVTSISATYSQSGTTITVTSTAHGLGVGDRVWLDFTSGTATDNTYTVATVAADSFTVTATSPASTSGSVGWIRWTVYSGVNEVYATSFRYFRVRYDFSSTGGDDLLLLNNLNVRLDSKIRNDAGTGIANSGDSGGTVVNFNVDFVDVQSITVTPITPVPAAAVIAVYDFVDVPDPDSFKVLLYNTSGTRVSGNFSWSARGV